MPIDNLTIVSLVIFILLLIWFIYDVDLATVVIGGILIGGLSLIFFNKLDIERNIAGGGDIYNLAINAADGKYPIAAITRNGMPVPILQVTKDGVHDMYIQLDGVKEPLRVIIAGKSVYPLGVDKILDTAVNTIMSYADSKLGSFSTNANDELVLNIGDKSEAIGFDTIGSGKCHIGAQYVFLKGSSVYKMTDRLCDALTAYSLYNPAGVYVRDAQKTPPQAVAPVPPAATSVSSMAATRVFNQVQRAMNNERLYTLSPTLLGKLPRMWSKGRNIRVVPSVNTVVLFLDDTDLYNDPKSALNAQRLADVKILVNSLSAGKLLIVSGTKGANMVLAMPPRNLQRAIRSAVRGNYSVIGSPVPKVSRVGGAVDKVSPLQPTPHTTKYTPQYNGAITVVTDVPPEPHLIAPSGGKLYEMFIETGDMTTKGDISAHLQQKSGKSLDDYHWDGFLYVMGGKNYLRVLVNVDDFEHLKQYHKYKLERLLDVEEVRELNTTRKIIIMADVPKKY